MKQRLWTKNFTLLVLGQASSLFGNLILRLALSLYVLQATGSATVFAGILSCATVPTVLFSPLGGILADRTDKRHMMVSLDALTGICVLWAALCLCAANALWVIGALLLLLAVLGAFETPTVQACLPALLTGANITKGNAVVNQVASVSHLVSPMLGSMLYAAFGLKPVMYASVGCFLITALFECFIKLRCPKAPAPPRVLAMVKQDVSASLRFLLKEEPGILKLLLFTALSRFFVMGITLVGLPYMVCTLLGLNPRYYGAAESALAVATILGSLAAGLLAGRWQPRRLHLLLVAIGASILLAGLPFLVPAHPLVRYAVNVVAFCGVQVAVSIFSIFAVSMIQQRTPPSLIGKVMAYTSAITLCAQPLGQMVYGLLFDRWSHAVYLVLLPSGILVCGIGWLARRFFSSLQC